MVINHLLTGMILQVRVPQNPPKKNATWQQALFFRDSFQGQ